MAEQKDGGAAFPIEVGMVAVISDAYGWALAHVTKVTDAQVKVAVDGFPKYERTYRKPQVKFAGKEDAARLLYERLKSSHAQLNEETRNAGLRRSKRDADFISTAFAHRDREK